MKNRLYTLIIFFIGFSIQSYSQTLLNQIEAKVQWVDNTTFNVVFTPNINLSGNATPLNVLFSIPSAQQGGVSFNIINDPYGLSNIPVFQGDNGGPDYIYFYSQSSAIDLSTWTSGSDIIVATYQITGGQDVPVTLIGDEFGVTPNVNGDWNGTSLEPTTSNDNYVIWPIINNTVSLPIIITTFQAEKLSEQSARLYWETSSEINSDYFVVQRSTDTQNWESLGSVKAAGNSITTQTYEFLDNQIPRTLREDIAVYYYRLVSVDLDGQYDLSEIRTLSFKGVSSNIVIYPNPTMENIVIDLTSLEGQKTVQLIDIQGRLIYEQKVTDEYNDLPVLNLKSMGLDQGTYIVRVAQNDTQNVHIEKVIFID